MKIKDLIDHLTDIYEYEGEGNEDICIKILAKTLKGSFGAATGTGIKNIYLGSDWDQKTILISTNDELVINNDEIEKAMNFYKKILDCYKAFKLFGHDRRKSDKTKDLIDIIKKEFGNYNE